MPLFTFKTNTYLSLEKNFKFFFCFVFIIFNRGLNDEPIQFCIDCIRKMMNEQIISEILALFLIVKCKWAEMIYGILGSWEKQQYEMHFILTDWKKSQIINIKINFSVWSPLLKESWWIHFMVTLSLYARGVDIW